MRAGHRGRMPMPPQDLHSLQSPCPCSSHQPPNHQAQTAAHIPSPQHHAHLWGPAGASGGARGPRAHREAAARRWSAPQRPPCQERCRSCALGRWAGLRQQRPGRPGRHRKLARQRRRWAWRPPQRLRAQPWRLGCFESRWFAGCLLGCCRGQGRGPEQGRRAGAGRAPPQSLSTPAGLGRPQPRCGAG